MLSAFKRLPVLAKILIVFVPLSVIYGLARDSRSHHASYTSSYDTASATETPASEDRRQGSETSGADRRLVAQYQAEYDDLSARAAQCTVEIQRFQSQMAMAAANGYPLPPDPPCEQQGAAWTARMAFLHAEIAKAQGADRHASVRELNGMPEYSPSASPSSRRASSSDGGDDGAYGGATGRHDIQGIRGNSYYRSENGQTYELATMPYYYRDRATGQMIGSESSESPDNLRDYEQLTPQ
jgi:hypothetical protein